MGSVESPGVLRDSHEDRRHRIRTGAKRLLVLELLLSALKAVASLLFQPLRNFHSRPNSQYGTDYELLYVELKHSNDRGVRIRW